MSEKNEQNGADDKKTATETTNPEATAIDVAAVSESTGVVKTSGDDSTPENQVSAGANPGDIPPKEALTDDILAEWLDIDENLEKTPDFSENYDKKSDKEQQIPQDQRLESFIDDKRSESEISQADSQEEIAAQLAETRDQLLRKAADFENFRKRINVEKQKAIEFANESLLLDIIPIIDDFERAIQSAEASAELKNIPAGKAMLDGITMIEKRLVNQLDSKWGLKRFNSAGEPFNPNTHEAVLMDKSADIEEPVVAEDLVKGYTLKDRVIRAAKVKVLMPKEGG